MTTTATITCLHTWTVESSHRTSEGTVVYEGCTCGSHRILHHSISPLRATWASSETS